MINYFNCMYIRKEIVIIVSWVFFLNPLQPIQRPLVIAACNKFICKAIRVYSLAYAGHFLTSKMAGIQVCSTGERGIEKYWFFSGENTLNNIMLGSPKRARLIRAGTVQGTASAGRRMVPACLTQPSSSGTSGYSQAQSGTTFKVNLLLQCNSSYS